MFSKSNKYLAGLLIFQIFVLILLNTITGSSSQNAKVNFPWKFQTKNARSLEIFESKDQAIKFSKIDNKWLIEGVGFPANQDKLETLLDKISNLRTGYAEGTTLQAAKKLKTSEEDYARKVIIQLDDAKQTIYFGDVPTYKKIYARMDGSNQTYVVDFQAYELKSDAEAWYDPNLLKLNKDNIQKITFSDLEIVRNTEKEPVVTNLSETEESNQEKLTQLLTQLAEMNYIELPDALKPEELNKLTAFTFQITYQGKDLIYELYGPVEDKESKSFYLKSSEQPYYFKIQESKGEQLNQINRAALVRVKELESSDSETES